MEKINVAEILENKPQGIKLYSPIFGECTFVNVVDGTEIIQVKKDDTIFTFDQYGRYFSNGECLLFPSNKMRNWSKFTWKRGDVLVTDTNTYCIFEDWENDNYLQFKAKYIYRKSNLHVFYSDEAKSTYCWKKVKDIDDINLYIDVIERAKGGKLNLKTLEIEKLPELKSFDKILVRNYDNQPWRLNIFSHYDKSTIYKYACVSGNFLQCIPYNDQTAHLLGTTDTLDN